MDNAGGVGASPGPSGRGNLDEGAGGAGTPPGPEAGTVEARVAGAARRGFARQHGVDDTNLGLGDTERTKPERT